MAGKAFGIHDNLAILGGRVVGIQKNNGWSKALLRVPFTKKKDDNYIVEARNIPIDLMDNEGVELGNDLRKGDFVVLQGYLGLYSEKDQEGHNVRMLSPQWDPYSKPTIIRGDGQLPPIDGDGAKEGFNIVRLAGLAYVKKHEKEAGNEHPQLREAGQSGNKFCCFDLKYQQGSDDPLYHDIVVWGASAEKFLSKWLDDGDNVLVRGQVGIRQSKDKFLRKRKNDAGDVVDDYVNISTPTIQVDWFNGVSKVKPAQMGGDGGGGGKRRGPRRHDNDQEV